MNRPNKLPPLPRLSSRSGFLVLAGLMVLAIALGGSVSVAGEASETEAVQAFWLSVVDDGAYRVTHGDLSHLAAIGSIDSDLLTLTNEGRSMPLWIHDGGDGSFDPGDSFEFLGRHLSGDNSFYSEHSHHNVYRLSLDGEDASRMTLGQAPADSDLSVASYRVERHFENDAVMVRFAQGRDEPETEIWFWQRLSFLQEEPFRLDLDLEGLAPGPATLRVQMRGWSRQVLAKDSTAKQHRVELSINDAEVAAGDWDGQDVLDLEAEIPAAVLDTTETSLFVRVPKRLLEGEEDPIVDLSLLNWIEIDYPHDGTVRSAQTRLSVTGTGRRRATVRAPGARSLIAFDDSGSRWAANGDGIEELALETVVVEEGASLVAVRDDEFRSPAGIAVDRQSRWRHPDRQADYLMIAHSSLLESAERLAAFHRGRGLAVALIDVQDVYDEFNHGIVHPRAIRDFVAYAYDQWLAPAPRFVLLVGDASWDVDRQDTEDQDYADWSYQPREGTREGFLKNLSTPYAEGPDNRGLIPTGSFRNAEGHAASDNYFVALDEGDFHPSLAVGRFPVVETQELDAIIDKTIRYAEESGVGPWRRNVLWISNEDEYIQVRTDRLAKEHATRGFSGAKVYPQKTESSNQPHQERLLEAFAEGQLVVHFHGHGGRYIWRTGPTDYRKNRDLFNLDHLDELQPSSRLPVVLSMTCFSAPFDHPLADSIGEKFLRLPDRGAIAVLAASWRNSPATDFSRKLVEELTRPQTIGEAILKAKRESKRKDMVETYNLLGDPAVPVAAPQAVLEVSLNPDDSGRLRLEASFPPLEDGFDGRALVDWIGPDGVKLATLELAAPGGRLAMLLTDAPDETEAVSIYMWDEGRDLDGIGSLSWAEDDEEKTVAGAASH